MNALRLIREVLSDVARLRLPVTAAALTTTVIGLVQPFGFDLSPQTTQITAALTAVGLLAGLFSRWLSDDEPPSLP